jgi:DNA-binding transcriptional LysR family regulator
MVRPPASDDVVAVPFARHEYVIVAPPAHPLAGQARIPLARVMEEPFVLREVGSDTANAMQEALGGRLPRIAMQIASNETIKQAVIAGFGLSFLSAHAIALERALGRLAMLDVEGFPARGHWYVVHRRTKRLPPVAAAFRSFLLDEGDDLVATLG